MSELPKTPVCEHCKTSLGNRTPGFASEEDGLMHPPTRCLEIVKLQRDTARSELTSAADTIEQLKKDLLFAANIHPRRTNAQKGLHCVKCRRALQDGEEIFGDVLHIRSNQIFTAHFIGWCLDCSSRYCFKDEESER